METGMFSPSNFTFNIHALPPFVTACLVLALGLIVVVREKGSRVSLLYLSYTLSASVWLFSASLALFMSTEELAFQWMKFANAGVTMIPASLYHFTIVVLEAGNEHRWRIRFAWAFSTLFLAVSLLTNVLFDRFYHYSWGIYLKFRWPAFLFMLFFFVMTIDTMRMYWVESKRPDRNKTKRRRARAFLFAFGIGYLGTLDFLPAIGIPYYPLSSVPMICMLILVSRTIWRYRLVDITPAFAAREIIDTMNDGLIVLDADKVVRLVNHATCGLLDCPEQDLIGKRPTVGMTACGEFAEELESIIGNHTVRDREVVCSANGAARTLNLSTSIMRDAAGERVATVCMVNDITDRKRAEAEREGLIRQLQEANEKLQSIDIMKTNFISMVSHELRTPLTSIKAFVELLLMKQSMPEEKKVRLMSAINIETDRLTRLLTDLLDLARIEAGSMRWQFVPLSLEDLIRTITASMEALFENKNLQVKTDIEPSLPRVTGDHDRLTQVVTNILSNAVKFTPPGGEIRIVVRRESASAQAVVEISDTGIGVSTGELDLIFEKFHRSIDPVTATIEGTGLGLAISRQIIEHHGGRIWATSTQGKGSTFTFTVPFEKAQEGSPK